MATFRWTVEVTGLDDPTTPAEHDALAALLHALTLVATDHQLVADLPGADGDTRVSVAAGLDVLAHKATSHPLVGERPEAAARRTGHPSGDCPGGLLQRHLVALEGGA